MKKKYRKIRIHKSKKKYSSYKLKPILYPKILKLFFVVVLLSIYFTNNKKYKNIIHLSLNMDYKYIYPCIVFLTSLLDNRANSTFYMIYILGNNELSDFSKKKIDKLIERFGNLSANIIYYNLEGYFKNATVWHIPVATYYKIFCLLYYQM